MTGAPAPMRLEPDFDGLFRAHHHRVLGLCRHLLRSADEAEDAAHEVFLRGRQRFDGYDLARPFSSWILTIASHHCVDRLRRRGTETRLFGTEDLERAAVRDDEPSPLGALIARERGQEVRRALAELPVKYRVPLALVYYDDLTYAEIGTILGIRRGHVAVLIFRAKRELRRMLERDERRHR